MQVPSIKLSQFSQTAAKKIIKASKNKTDIGQQAHMANYYAFLHSQPEKDKLVCAKLLMSK